MLQQILTITINGVHITIYETMGGNYQTQYGLSHKGFPTLDDALTFFNDSIRHALVTDGLLD